MRPNVDVAGPVLLRERDPDQAVGGVELEPGDKGGGSLRDPHRLLVLEPMTDASAEELGDVCELRLVPTEPGLEITDTGSLVLEQTVKLQPGRGHSHGNRCVTRKSVCRGRRKLHASMFAADLSPVCYEARATSSRGCRRDTTCETPSGPIVTP
jgi:hypothetical protein